MAIILFPVVTLLYCILGVFFAELIVGWESDWSSGMFIFTVLLWPLVCILGLLFTVIWFSAIVYPVKFAKWAKKRILKELKLYKAEESEE